MLKLQNNQYILHIKGKKSFILEKQHDPCLLQLARQITILEIISNKINHKKLLKKKKKRRLKLSLLLFYQTGAIDGNRTRDPRDHNPML